MVLKFLPVNVVAPHLKEKLNEKLFFEYDSGEGRGANSPQTGE